jgi:hypothetical protein
VVLVELPAQGVAKMTLAPLDTGRRLVELTATLDELPRQAKELDGCFVRVTVPVDGPVPGLSMRVREALRGSIVIQTTPELHGAGKAQVRKVSDESSDLGEMLERWLAEHELTGVDVDRSAGAVRDMVANARAQRRNALVGEDLLDADIAAELSDELTEAMGWVDLDAEAAAAELVGSLADIDGDVS